MFWARYCSSAVSAASPIGLDVRQNACDDEVRAASRQYRFVHTTLNPIAHRSMMAVSNVVSRRVAKICFIAIVIASFSGVRAQQPVSSTVYVSGELIVQFKPGVDELQRAPIRAAHAARTARRYPALDMER